MSYEEKPTVKISRIDDLLRIERFNELIATVEPDTITVRKVLTVADLNWIHTVANNYDLFRRNIPERDDVR